MSASIKPQAKLQSERLVDKVYGLLHSEIINGNLLPGQALSVPEISRQLGVSRSPVREAVLQLVADGLAWEKAHKGAVVAQFGLEDALQILEAREILEVASVSLGTVRATTADFVALEQVLRSQQQSVQKANLRGYLHSDLEFHKLLGSLSHNPALGRMVGLLKDQSLLAQDSVSHSLVQLEMGFKEHQAVLEALESRNSEEAARALLKHFKRIREGLEKWLALPRQP